MTEEERDVLAESYARLSIISERLQHSCLNGGDALQRGDDERATDLLLNAARKASEELREVLCELGAMSA